MHLLGLHKPLFSLSTAFIIITQRSNSQISSLYFAHEAIKINEMPGKKTKMGNKGSEELGLLS